MFKTMIWFLKFAGRLIGTKKNLKLVKDMIKNNQLEKSQDLAFQTAKTWARQVVIDAGGEVELIGSENLPDGPVLFVANHQSNFDIPILLGFIDKPKGFIAKIELEKFPIISEWMRYVDCIFMDRSSVRQSLKAINEGIEKLKLGRSLVIFPEGTRSKDGKLREFKSGSLKLATKSKVPIVPITIDGSIDMMEKKKIIIKSAKVKLTISKPIYTDNLTKEEEKNIHELVKDIIQKNLDA